MTLTAEDREIVKSWRLGFGSPGKVMQLDLPREVRGPYGEHVLSYSFLGFKAGQRVELDGRFLANRVQWATEYKWEILRFCTSLETGFQWVELYGGSPKWAHVFAVCPEALKVDAPPRR
uniref:Minor tail protein n=1 Tax=Micrococcus phage Kurnik TaxID=3092208 RepID=A0AAU6R6A5_9CAUD